MDMLTPPRILCIAPHFAPVVDSESFCGAKMVKALLDVGLDVKVIYSTNYPAGRSAPLDTSAAWEFTHSTTIDIPVSARKERLRSLFTALSYHSHYARWVDSVVRRAVELHEERRFDLIYSRSWPMLAHVAGFWCARKLRLPWIANINDPWDVCYFPGVRKEQTSWSERRFARLWLKRTFAHAQLLTFPSQQLAEFHFRLSRMAPPTKVIPHVGYSKDTPSVNTQSTKDLFRIVHAGKLGASELSGRSTSGLLRALASFLAKTPDAQSVTRLVLIGPNDDGTMAQAEALGLTGNIISVGPVSYEQSLVYISQASVCLLVEAKMDEGIYLPSKLVDYIVSRKPILALSPEVGVVSELSQRGGIMRVDTDNPLAIEKAIADLYSDFRTGVLMERAPDRLAKHFEPQEVARQFLDALRGIVPQVFDPTSPPKKTADQT
jgi:hypothetical protein